MASASCLFLFSVYQQTSNSIGLPVDNGNVTFVPCDWKRRFLSATGVNKKTLHNVIFGLGFFFSFEHFDHWKRYFSCSLFSSSEIALKKLGKQPCRPWEKPDCCFRWPFLFSQGIVNKMGSHSNKLLQDSWINLALRKGTYKCSLHSL